MIVTPSSEVEFKSLKKHRSAVDAALGFILLALIPLCVWTLFMPDWWHSQSPYYDLIVGCILLSAAVVWTCTGKAKTRPGWVYRADKPIGFWFTVALYYLGGIYFMRIFLLKVYGPSILNPMSGN